MNWQELVIAVLGGDEREAEIARLAAATGATVSAYGFPWPEAGVSGVRRASGPVDAIAGARYALLPIPGLDLRGALFAPAAPEPIVPDAELLARMAAPAHVVLGSADDRLRGAAAEVGVTLHEYEHDRELMMLRGPAIVEGAIGLAIELTDVTIHAANVAVVGFGNVGSLLTRTLVALGAHVTVVARDPVQRATAYAIGAEAVPIDALATIAPDTTMLFSTVPHRLVGRELLERFPPGALMLDLAAPPGGIDLDLARELGHRTAWGRGLGRRAPVTVGASQWAGVRARIEAAERGAQS